MKSLLLLGLMFVPVFCFSQYVLDQNKLVIPSVFKNDQTSSPASCGTSTWNGNEGFFSYPSVNAVALPAGCTSGNTGANGPHSNGSCHFGEDYWAQDWNWGTHDTGLPIYTPCGAKLLFSGVRVGYGNTVLLLLNFSAGGNYYVIRYAHLKEIFVDNISDNISLYDESRSLKRTTQIGTLGNTGNSNGPHLHLSVYRIPMTDTRALQNLMKGFNAAGVLNSVCDANFAQDYAQEFIMDMSLNSFDYEFPVNYSNPVFCGSPITPFSRIPVLFKINDASKIVSSIADIVITDPVTGDTIRTGVYTPGSIRNCFEGNWQFKFDIAGLAYNWDVSKKYTLKFKAVRSDGVSGIKEAKEQLIFRNTFGFTDLTQPFYRCYIERGISNGLYSGKSNLVFDPEHNLSRGEMAKVIVNAAILLGDQTGNESLIKKYNLEKSAGTFSDVTENSPWYPYVQTLRNAGFLSTASSQFNPSSAASIGAFCKIAAKVFNINSTNVADFRKVLSRIKISPSADPDFKLQMENLLGTYFIANCNTGYDLIVLESLVAAQEFSNSGSAVTLSGYEPVKRKTMARMINGLFFYRLSKQGNVTGNRPAATNNLLRQTNATTSILGSKYEVLDGSANTLLIPVSLASEQIRLSDSLQIGTGNAVDNNGNPVYYYWLADKGALREKTNDLSKVIFYPEGLQVGDTASIYCFVANANGQYVDGVKKIIIKSASVNWAGVNINIPTTSINFNQVNTSNYATKTITFSNPASSNNYLNGNIAISGTAFSIVSGGGSFSLPPGTDRQILVKFSPISSGSQTGALTISHNAVNQQSPTFISLSGTGVISSVSNTVNCDNVIPISCGNWYEGNTSNGVNLTTSYFGLPVQFTGKEKIHSYQVPETGLLSFHFFSPGDNQYCFVYTGCDISNTNSGGLYYCPYSWDNTIAVTAGQVIYFIVDGKNNYSGAYKIFIKCQTPVSNIGLNCISVTPLQKDWGYATNFATSTDDIVFSNTSNADVTVQYYKKGDDQDKLYVLTSIGNAFSLSPGQTKSISAYMDLPAAGPYKTFTAELVVKFLFSSCNIDSIVIPFKARTNNTYIWDKPSDGYVYTYGNGDNDFSFHIEEATCSNAIFSNVQFSKDGGVTWTKSGLLGSVPATFNGCSNTLLMGNDSNVTRLGKFRVRQGFSSAPDSSANWYYSPGYFKIRKERNASLNVLFPDIMDTIYCGQPVDIKWEDPDGYGSDITYDVLFSRDGGITWLPQDVIVSAQSYSCITPGCVQTYSWHPPAGLSTSKLKIRVRRTYATTVFDESDGNNITFCATQPALAITSTISNPSCNGVNNGAISLNTTGGSGVYSFSWKKNGNALSSFTNAISALDTGTYVYTVNDGAGLIGAGEIVLGVLNPISLSFNSSPSHCLLNNGAVQSVVTGGSSRIGYLWSNAEVTKNITGLAAGEYKLTVTDSLTGCRQSGVATIGNTGAEINMSVNGPYNVCTGDSVAVIVAVANGTDPLLFQFDGAAFQTANSKQLTAGVHTILVKDASGCSNLNTVEVFQNPDILNSLSVSYPVCDITGNVIVNSSGGSGDYQYKWDNGLYETINNKLQDTGFHTISVFDGICVKTDSFYVVSTSPYAYFEADTNNVQFGDSVMLNSYSYGAAQSTWFLNGRETSNAASVKLKMDSLGKNSIKLLVRNNSCTDSSEIVFHVKDKTICPGGNISFNAAANNAVNYRWQVDTGTGYFAVSNGTVYAGAATAVLLLNAPPTNWYGYKLRCLINNSFYSPVYTLKFSMQWSGNADSSWSNPQNWTCSVLPDEFVDVIIPAGKTNYPVISASAKVNSLKMENGTAIKLLPGVHLEVKNKK